MRSTKAHVAIAIVLMQLLASAGTAEIFRWRDARGVEHFSMDLNSVPGEYRAAAEASAGKVGRKAIINRYDGSDASSARRSSASTVPAARALGRDGSAVGFGNGDSETIAGKDEAGWRSSVQGLKDEISVLEIRIESCEDLPKPRKYDSRTGRGYRRQHYERKLVEIQECSRSKSNLVAKKRQLENLTERARTSGVPPGWLRSR